MYIGQAFGRFNVNMVSEEARDLLARGEKTKFHDFE
jgi:hypothetical protein